MGMSLKIPFNFYYYYALSYSIILVKFIVFRNYQNNRVASSIKIVPS